MEQTSLTAAFQDVRRAYFPRWDRERAWAAEFAGTELCRGSSGYCDSQAKRIYIDGMAMRGIPKVGLATLLIHEICHAVARDGHRLRWAKRMADAAERALHGYEEELAESIQSDIYSYCGASVFAAATGLALKPVGDTYGGILPWIIPDLETIWEAATKLRSAMEWLSADTGMLDHFPRERCSESSSLLLVHFHHLGIKGFRLVRGLRPDMPKCREENTGHEWVQRGSLVVDITADQFGNEQMPAVFVGESAWHARLEGHRHRHALNDFDLPHYMRRLYPALLETKLL